MANIGLDFGAADLSGGGVAEAADKAESTAAVRVGAGSPVDAGTIFKSDALPMLTGSMVTGSTAGWLGTWGRAASM
jgi:hypothetical protein